MVPALQKLTAQWRISPPAPLSRQMRSLRAYWGSNNCTQPPVWTDCKYSKTHSGFHKIILTSSKHFQLVSNSIFHRQSSYLRAPLMQRWLVVLTGRQGLFGSLLKCTCSTPPKQLGWILVAVLANTASCTEKFVLSENLDCPWMGFMKIKDKKNYSFVFFFKWWSALYPQGLHKCRSHPRCCGILILILSGFVQIPGSKCPKSSRRQKKV